MIYSNKVNGPKEKGASTLFFTNKGEKPRGGVGNPGIMIRDKGGPCSCVRLAQPRQRETMCGIRSNKRLEDLGRE